MVGPPPDRGVRGCLATALLSRIRENYHQVPRIRENRVPRIREIVSLQVHTECLTFSFKKTCSKLYKVVLVLVLSPTLTAMHCIAVLLILS